MLTILLFYQILQITYKIHLNYINNIVSSGTFMLTLLKQTLLYMQKMAKSIKVYKCNT